MGVEVFAVTPNVWCVRRQSYLTCSYLVRRKAGIVLVNAGMDSHGADIEQGLDVAFGAAPEDVSAILLTHWHNDHAAGAAAVKARSGARVYYHAGDEPMLTRATAKRGARGRLSEWIPELGPLVLAKGLLGEATPRAVTAERLVRDGEMVAGDFEVLETPGHTPGHLSFYFAPERILFAGDALAVVDDDVRFMARPVTPDLEAARRSMLRCLEHPLSWLCPGHRRPLGRDVEAKCRAVRERLVAGAAWPLFG